MYVGILFGLGMAMFYVYVVLWGGISTLVQMVPPCSIYVGILFSHSMWVCLVQLCSTYVGILFGCRWPIALGFFLDCGYNNAMK